MHVNHNIWASEYRARRYMEHLNEEELIQRLADVVENLTEMNSEGRLYLSHPSGESTHFLMLWSHILEEYVIRGAGYEPGITMGRIPLPRSEWPHSAQAAAALRKAKLRPQSYLLKYGKQKYLEPMYANGLIRIAPASSYEDSSLNSAIQDKELEMTVELLPSETTLTARDGRTGESKGVINPIGNVKMTHLSKTDYYVYCLSSAYDIRLFDKFDADCCLVINEPKEFIRRLLSCFDKQLPGWSSWDQSVAYVDPLLITGGELDVFFSKHFRYSYQREYRIVWLPPSRFDKLASIHLTLGPLDDCCKLLVL
jgi:hypothetical protein